MDSGIPQTPKNGVKIFLSIFQENGFTIILRPKWGKFGEKGACGINKSKYAKNEIRVAPPLKEPGLYRWKPNSQVFKTNQ